MNNEREEQQHRKTNRNKMENEKGEHIKGQNKQK